MRGPRCAGVAGRRECKRGAGPAREVVGGVNDPQGGRGEGRSGGRALPNDEGVADTLEGQSGRRGADDAIETMTRIFKD